MLTCLPKRPIVRPARSLLSAALLPLALSAAPLHAEQSFDGSVELEHRQFFDQRAEGRINSSSKGQTSAALTLNFLSDWNAGDDRLEIETFLRIDEADSERSHADLRQFIWTHFGDNYEFSAGIGRVFWGVTETQHLVDIINQTDLVENIDAEDKLGQPMIRYQRFSDYGTFDFFLLPLFRERTFEGEYGRLNGGLVVLDDPIYDSDSGSSNLDAAVRYSNSFGAIDLGLSWFSGTSRDANLFSNLNQLRGTTRAFYPKIDQYGLDLQLTEGGWLLKLEAIQRNFDLDEIEDYAAITAGFEYTLVGILGSQFDLGLLSEYSWDERREAATTPFQDDTFVGARLALNDVAGSEFLFGVSKDMEFSNSRALLLEGSTRINNSLVLNVEARYFDSDVSSDPLFSLKDSSYFQVGLEFFFD